MDKELELIRQKLSDTPSGHLIEILHLPDGRTSCRDITDINIPSEARLRTESFELYPGICFSFHYYMAEHFRFHHTHGKSVFSVDHCRTGRIGWEMKDGLSLYYGSGDLSFHYTDKCSDSRITLPLGYYEGSTISLDLRVLKEKLPDLMAEAGIDAEELCRRFCGEEEAAALPANSRIDHVFSEVYELPEQIKLPYLKLKCQELLFFLSMTESDWEKALDPQYPRQVEIIKDIHRRITAHPEHRYTIDALSREYLINTAALKSVFKSVYGMPVASYMKQYRITKAAGLLRSTDASIASIARTVGYESQSKFTAAFKEIMKILPSEYRRQYM